MGCRCADFNDTYSLSNFPSVSFGTQHSSGQHTLTGELDGTCSFEDSTTKQNGQYLCESAAFVAISANNLSDSGPTLPTYIGSESPVVHKGASGSYPNSSGPLRLGASGTTGVIAAGVTECWTSDSGCTGGSLTWIGPSWTYHPVVGTYGSNLTAYLNMGASFSQLCPALSAPAPSPIVIPLNGGDYHDAFSNFDAGEVVQFDFAGNGRPIWMSWIQKGAPYGFLVLFRDAKGNPDPNWQTNGNTIDSSRKMFGNLTRQTYDPTTMPSGSDGMHHPNGFLALRVFDDCKPEFRKGGKCRGVLNSEAAVWSQLRVWVDTDMTGDSRFGQLLSLDQLGITEIKLSYVEENRRDRYGNKLAFKGAMIQHGQVVPIYDVYFRAQ